MNLLQTILAGHGVAKRVPDLRSSDGGGCGFGAGDGCGFGSGIGAGIGAGSEYSSARGYGARRGKHGCGAGCEVWFSRGDGNGVAHNANGVEYAGLLGIGLIPVRLVR